MKVIYYIFKIILHVMACVYLPWLCSCYCFGDQATSSDLKETFFAQSNSISEKNDNKNASSSDNNDSDNQLSPLLIHNVIQLIRTSFVEPVRQDKLVESALNGMLVSLDPHSGYLSGDEYKEIENLTQGKYVGIGVEFVLERGFIKVISPIDGTPAYRAGIQSGDIITHINSQVLSSLSLVQIIRLIRGEENSSLSLIVRRNGTDLPSVEVKREKIKIDPIRYDDWQGIGYVRIATFVQEGTAKIINETIKNFLKKYNNTMKGLIIDLRNNPGGLLEEAVAVSELFLKKDLEVVSIRNRDSQLNRSYKVHNDEDIASGIPIVILINAGTASAAEIVSGALQDHKRAIIIGVNSFGKGSVQKIIPLPNKYGAIRLTTAIYHTPSGRSLQAQGIEPDIIIPQAKIEIITDIEKKREKDIPTAIQNKIAESIGSVSKTITSIFSKNLTRGEQQNTEQQNTEQQNKENCLEKNNLNPGEANLLAVKSSITKPSLERDRENDYQLTRAIDLLLGLDLMRGIVAKR